jgi:peroxiredoxin Q/BCP
MQTGVGNMLQPGIKAPFFMLPDSNGRVRSLSEFAGKKVILYFYPKDNTSGCTKQACGFAELYPRFTEKGAVVIGISADSAASHQRFAEKYSLPFILLSDRERTVMGEYDVLKEKKSSTGREVYSTVRTTYIIDEQGYIEKAFGEVKAAENPSKMLEEIS